MGWDSSFSSPLEAGNLSRAGLRNEGNPAILALLVSRNYTSGGRCCFMMSVFDFIVSVMAGVVSYYLYKWFDRRNKGQ
jgi:hypothetical protein